MKGSRSLRLVLLAMFVVGCSAKLPQHLHEQVEEMPKRLETARGKVASSRQTFDSVIKSQEYKTFLATYDTKEKWVEKFSQAIEKVDTADRVYKTRIEPIMKENKPESEKEATNLILAFNTLLKEADTLSDYPGNRMARLEEAKEHSSQMIAQARTQWKATKSVHDEIASVTKKAATDFPAKKDDIATRMSPFNRLYDTSNKCIESAEKEFKSNKPDYSVLADSCTTVEKNLGEYQTKSVELKEKLAELGRSYSKTLVDMNVDYYVVIGRTDWDEWAEFDNDSDYTFAPVKVDASVYQQWEQLGNTGNDVSVSEEQVTAFGLDPNENQSSGSREFWLSDLQEKYFHKYLVVENGQKSTSDWEEVTEAFFDEHEYDLGMDIVSKPYGLYEDEVIDEAAPPGIAYVNNSRYGHWKDDGHGNSFWEWYGQYAFYRDMLGGPQPYYYSRTEWNDWHRNYRGEEPYYGPNKEKRDRYGVGSVYINSRYGNSNWVMTGGYNRQMDSVRSAGGSFRAGGPGGGGK
jgi:hypothetical protein